MEKEIMSLIKKMVKVDIPIKQNMYLIQDLKFDSLSFYELVLNIEEKYNIHFEEEDIWKIQTVGDIIKNIKEKRRIICEKES